MDNTGVAFLNLLTAKPFQRSPRPNVTVDKLTTALHRLGHTQIERPELVRLLQLAKGQGLANTIPKILLPEELDTAEFQIWITPLGRDRLAALTSS